MLTIIRKSSCKRDCQLRDPDPSRSEAKACAPHYVHSRCHSSKHYPRHLLLLVICHATLGLVLLCDSRAALLMRRNFLVLLDQVAETAAAGRGDVDEAAALEVVTGADFGTLHRHGNPVETDAASTADEKALDMTG